MELRHLKTFRTVAILGSFYKAANVLNYAQSTVSEQIKALENDLDVRLFTRSGKSIALTAAGELLLDYSQKDGTHGSLSIRIPETVSIHYLPPVLREFHTQYPKIQCDFTNCAFMSLQQEFMSGITDLAFVITNQDYRPPNLNVEILGRVPLILVTYPEHPLCAKHQINIHDLNGQTIVLPKNDCSYRKMLEKAMTEHKVEPNVIWSFNSLDAIKSCLMAGTGVSFISEIAVAEEVNFGQLIKLPFTSNFLEANLLMIRRNSKWLSPALQVFTTILRRKLSE